MQAVRASDKKMKHSHKTIIPNTFHLSALRAVAVVKNSLTGKGPITCGRKGRHLLVAHTYRFALKYGISWFGDTARRNRPIPASQGVRWKRLPYRAYAVLDTNFLQLWPRLGSSS